VTIAHASDFTTLSAIGSVEQKISLPKCRQLISSNPGAVAVYAAEMERQFDIHRIEERLAEIDEATAGQFPIPEEYQIKADHLDKQVILKFNCTGRIVAAQFIILIHLSQLIIQCGIGGNKSSNILWKCKKAQCVTQASYARRLASLALLCQTDGVFQNVYKALGLVRHGNGSS
jgi:hypothetical protein